MSEDKKSITPPPEEQAEESIAELAAEAEAQLHEEQGNTLSTMTTEDLRATVVEKVKEVLPQGTLTFGDQQTVVGITQKAVAERVMHHLGSAA